MKMGFFELPVPEGAHLRRCTRGGAPQGSNVLVGDGEAVKEPSD